MRIAVFSTKKFDREFLDAANERVGHELVYFEDRLHGRTAAMAKGFAAVCAFVNDRLDQETLKSLAAGGTRLIALRCAGYNNVDLASAQEMGITVLRVPAYSPEAVAEHAVGLMLMLNRNLYRAYSRVREGNFDLSGLQGFNMHGSTVGIVGVGKIGMCAARILRGFGCRLLGYDMVRDPAAEQVGIRYVDLPELLASSRIVTLHCPLTPETKHLINEERLAMMQDKAMLINTGRGGLLDAKAVIDALKSGKLKYLGIDVYEEEDKLFFEDLSGTIIQDDVFMRLTTFPNVVITGHQGFLTVEALTAISETTLQNVSDFAAGNINRANWVRALM